MTGASKSMRGVFAGSVRTEAVLAIALVLGITYWPVLVLLVFLAVLTAYFFARRGRHGGAL